MTKQMGKLKLHISSRGIAFKWGDGEIRRLSFPQRNQDQGNSAAANDGYAAPYEQGYQEDGYQQGYYGPDDYSNQNYDAEQDSGHYEPQGTGSPLLDLFYHNDWVTYALLVLVPPLGIWLLWRRERFEMVIRAAISAVAAIWFVILLIWLFSFIFGGTPDPQANVNVGGTLPPITSATADPSATDELDITVPTPSTTVEPAPSTGDIDEMTDTGTTTANEVYATAAGQYYHSRQDCTRISGTPQRMLLSVARGQGKTACPECMSGTGTGGGTSGTGGGTTGSTATGKYYATRTGRYYHVKATCSGMKNASQVTRAQAQKDGKTACPTCIGQYYMTNGGTYYHKTATCSGMTGAKLVTKAQATAAKKKKCPKCLGGTTTTTGVTYYGVTGGKYYHTKSTCSGMKGAKRMTLATAQGQGKTACPVCVKKTTTKTYYAATGGTYYHVTRTCSGMKGAVGITLTTAKKRGLKTCPVCMKTTATKYYYATQAGAYYHKNATCSGMKGAKRITLATAKKNNKKACPVCIGSASTNTYVYMNSQGKYYHSKNNCSGMAGAQKVTLSKAKNGGKTACPVCMKTVYFYTTAANKYYHKKAACSGMKNATKLTLVSAKSKGKAACPICVTGKAKPTDASTYCYATSGGRYYHKSKTCQGMKNAKKMTLLSAKGQGKTACPVCVKKKTTTGNTTQSADSRVACYLVKTGTYYHAKRSCSKLKGRTGIVKTSVSTAKKNGKAPCPECVSTSMRTYVYVRPSGLLYHRTATCSGKNSMKLTLKTALNRAYKRCTKCNAPAA